MLKRLAQDDISSQQDDISGQHNDVSSQHNDVSGRLVDVNSQLGDSFDSEDQPLREWSSGNSQAFVVSLVFHVALILGLSVVPVIVAAPEIFSFKPVAMVEEEPLRLIDEIAISDDPATEVGANSDFESGMALSTAPILAELSAIPTPSFEAEMPDVTFDLSNQINQAMGLVRSDTVVKGMSGVATTGTDGAVDRVTYEILRSMEERPTLVVWFFDQSGSLQVRRQEVRDRFDRIYEELGIVGRSRESKTKVREADEPLLTSIFAFGNEVSLLTPKPTADIDEIRTAIDSVAQDESGIERVFTALYKGIEKYKSYRTNRGGANNQRNVLFIVVTDERGDDANGLDATIRECRKYAIPVHVIGVPAPFGRDITYVKYVDPDPKYDQSPQWAEVDQGPESILPERVRLGYRDDFASEPVIDSGFGPYALSRLAYETGGIFFSVHPDRRVGSRVRAGEITPFASRFEYFFDPEVMQKYRPDYVSPETYMKRLSDSPLRQTLVRAAQAPRVDTLQRPEMRFVRSSDAALATALTAAQQQAARLEPQLVGLAEILRMGDSHRDKEAAPRWLAGFDLAYGTVLAHKVRAEGYNAMLAKAKRGMNFEKPESNTWVLQPDAEISVGSRLEKEGAQAVELLESVAKQHQGTPWGLLAKKELDNPIGWKWVEDTTDLNPPAANNRPNNNNVTLPRDDQARMLKPPPPRRPLPKL